MPRQMFCCDKHIFCRDKSMLVVTKKLSRKISLSRQNIFVSTKLLSRQIFVATNIIFVLLKFCCDKHTFVATSILLLRQTRVCCDKTRLLSKQKYSRRDKCFVAASILLLRQKMCFVVTKMILVAVPASDSLYRPVESALPRAL